MTDFLNKVITIILIFIMLVMAPLLISYASTDMVSERLILNEVTQFLDKMVDRETLTYDDLNSLYLSVNSHGGAYDVELSLYHPASIYIPNDDGSETIVKYVFIKSDEIDNWKYTNNVSNRKDINLSQNDVIKVHVKSIGSTPSKELLWSILRMDKGDFDITLAGTVL